MTDLSAELTSPGSENQAAINAGIAIAAPAKLDTNGRFFGVTTPSGGDFRIVDLEDHREHHRDRPRRKTGTVVVHDATSFVAYLHKHGLTETEVYADLNTQRLTAVINGHLGTTGDGIEDYAGWGDHRVTLRLDVTAGWAAWTHLDRKWLRQLDFAEHVEDRLPDFVAPTGADMLELAQSFSANRSVQFESSRRTKSGETTLIYKEEETAAAGRKGNMAIPDTFELGLVPFEGSEAYKVTARLRYRINDGTLTIGYILDRPEDVVRAAFLDIVEAVEDRSSRSVLRGVPA